MADEMNTDERAKFEAWCVTQGWVEKPSARPNGTYINGALQARWLGWSGRAALSPTTEDMATASAQGFRDGVASVSAAEPAVRFDAQGFREWVLRNLPDDTIIGSGLWWADHLTKYARLFVKSESPAMTPGAAITVASLAANAVPTITSETGNTATTQGTAITSESGAANAGSEPVAWMSRLPSGSAIFSRTREYYPDAVPVYTPPSPPEGAGWKWVPIEPTLAMGWAYLDGARESEPGKTHTFNHAGYRAMIAAAPTASDAKGA